MVVDRWNLEMLLSHEARIRRRKREEERLVEWETSTRGDDLGSEEEEEEKIDETKQRNDHDWRKEMARHTCGSRKMRGRGR